MVRWAATAGVVAVMMMGLCPPVQADEVRVFAPSGLQPALAEIVSGYHEPGILLVVRTGSSAELDGRMASGEPPDIVLTPDDGTMDRLAGQGRIWSASRVTLLGDRLVLVAAADSTLTLTMDQDLSLTGALDGGRLAMCRPDKAPLGRDGRAALVALGAWPQVEHRLLDTDSERETLTMVARGQAALGLVSSTGATTEPGVRVVATFPDAGHPAVVYPAALTSEAADAGVLHVFAYLRSPAALAVFSHYGFQPLP